MGNIALPVAFPGPAGSFSQQAAAAFFGEGAALRPFGTFEETLLALLQGEAEYAVLPIENSYTGAVSHTYDLLVRHRLAIVGEHLEPVVHHLLGVPGASLADIREVHSHPQALEQCRAFLSARPHMTPVPSLNTALSARSVAAAGKPSQAALAGRLAAALYGLSFLQEEVQDSLDNTTRFVVVGRDMLPLAPPDKASITFFVSNQAGSLARVLTCFARHGVSLSKIESRPIPGRPWEYFFFADFEEILDEAQLAGALQAAAGYTRELRLLGRYAKAR